MESSFTHVDATGRLRMVDVSSKRSTRRRALARCVVVTDRALCDLTPRRDQLDPAHAARVAGVGAAKRTSELIPLCHSINLNDVDVTVSDVAGGIEITASVTATQRTGVEMEALTACAIAAVSLIQSLRPLDPAARIDDLALLKKEGGKSGPWGRLVDGAPSELERRDDRSGPPVT